MQLFHPDYALEMAKAVAFLPKKQRIFIYQCVRGFHSAPESHLILQFVQIFSRLSLEIREQIVRLQERGNFGSFFFLPYESVSCWRWSLIKALTNIPENENQEKLIQKVLSELPDDMRLRITRIEDF